MVRSILTIIICVLSLGDGMSQGIVLQGNATLKLGSNSRFYAGPNTTFNGVVTNEGEIISYSDLDFVANRDVGSLKFVGVGNQNLLGDTLNVVNFEVVKDDNSTVVLLTDQVVVSEELIVTNGVVEAEDEEDLIVSGGSTSANGLGYVEGVLVGQTSGQPVTFPMGVNGNSNYITLSNTSNGVQLRVECAPADVSLFRFDENEDVRNVASEVEWVITGINEMTTDATVTINFSGVDLETDNLSDVDADAYRPTIMVLAPGDSLYRVLNATSLNNLYEKTVTGSLEIPTTDILTDEGNISIGGEPTRLLIGFIPVVEDFEFFVPTAFSPNATLEENRAFHPFASGDRITSFSMRIFNSLNVEVYSVAESGDDLDLALLGWNGILSSGLQAPGGVYYYSFNVDALNDLNDRQESGAVLLVE